MSRKIPVINGLRGWAIMAVILFHVYIGMLPPLREAVPHMDPGVRFLRTFILNGGRGVDLFFILSAFVLTLPYLRRERFMDTLSDAGWFFRHRAARLLPLFYVHLFLIWFILRPIPMQLEAVASHMFQMLTFTFHFSPTLWMPPYGAVLWSIGAEFWFCALLPLILVCMKKWGIIPTVVVMTAASFVMQYAGQIILDTIAINHISDSVIGRMDDFATGILIAYSYVHGIRPFGRYALPLGLLTCMLSFVFASLLRMGLMNEMLLPLLYLLMDIGFYLTVTAALHLRQQGIAYAFFANYPIQLTGLMCYSLYIWHNFGRFTIKPELNVRHLALYAFMTFIVGWLSYRYIEFGRVKDWKALLPARRAAPVPDDVPVQQPVITASPLPA